MRRNCNLELTLFPSQNSALIMEAAAEEEEDLSPQEQQQQQQQHQKLTIFYDGKICVSDVTQLQARSILNMVANKEMDERGLKRVNSNVGMMSSSSHQLYSPTTPTSSLSMKKSLQRFLHKRKTRIQEASPYHH